MKTNDEKNQEKLSKVSEELGFVKEINSSEELPDEELENVEGGWCFCLGGNSNNDDKPATSTR